MNDTKLWWQSRTIWLNIIGLVFALLASNKALPAGIDQQQVLETVMGVVAILSVVFRASATKAIGGAK